MNQTNTQTQTQPTDTPGRHAWVRYLIQLLLVGATVTAAWFFYQHQEATRPEARRQRPAQQARLVQVESARAGSLVVMLTEPMGPVVPARQVTLMPEISGQVALLDAVVIPGGLVVAPSSFFTHFRFKPPVLRHNARSISKKHL